MHSTGDMGVSFQLPSVIRLALTKAAKTPVDGSNPFARLKAIEDVQAKARAQFPHLFIKD